MKRAILAFVAASALAASAEESGWDEDATRLAKEEWGPGGRHPAHGLVAVPMDAAVLAPVRRACRLFRLEHRFLTAGGQTRLNPEIGLVWRDGKAEAAGDDAYDLVVQRAGLRADDAGRAAAAALRWTLDAWAHEEAPEFAAESRRIEVDGDVVRYRHFSLRFPGAFWLANAFLVFREGSLLIARRPAAIPRQVSGEELDDFLDRAGVWLTVSGPAPAELKDRVASALERARSARAAVAGWAADLGAEEPETRDKADAQLKDCGAWALPELEETARLGSPEARTRALRLLAWLRPGWREVARAEALRTIGDPVDVSRRSDAEPFAELPLQGDRLLPFRAEFAFYRATVADRTVVGIHSVTCCVRRGEEAGLWRGRASERLSPARELFLPAGAPETREALVALYLAVERQRWHSAYEEERLEIRGNTATYHVHELQVRDGAALWIEDATLEQADGGSVRITELKTEDLKRRDVVGFLEGQDGWLRVTGDMGEAEWRAYEAAQKRGRGPVVHGEDRRR